MDTRAPPLAIDRDERNLGAQLANRPLEQRGLAGARRGEQVDRDGATLGQAAAVDRRQRVVAGEDVVLEADEPVPVGRVVVTGVGVMVFVLLAAAAGGAHVRRPPSRGYGAPRRRA